MVLGRRCPGPPARVLRALSPGAGSVRRGAVGHVVRGREGEPGAQLRGSVGGSHPLQGGGALGGRRGGTAVRLVCRTARDGEPPGERAAFARRGAGRSRRDLHADGPGDGGRDPRLRQARGRLSAHLLRLRGRRGGHQTAGRRGHRPDHGGRDRPAGEDAPDEGSRRSSCRAVPFGRTRRRVVTART